jgi:hypothetical protein
MRAPWPLVLAAPPPVWDDQLALMRRMMRDLPAPALLLEGRLLTEAPTGPRIAALMDVPRAMGSVDLTRHPLYRKAMRGAAATITYVRMIALGTMGADPVTAVDEPEDTLHILVVLPDAAALVIRSAGADVARFLLFRSEPGVEALIRARQQLDFIGAI